MQLFTELITRVVIIITLTDLIIFYAITSKKLDITIPLVISIILVTLVPLVINIWFSLHRHGII